jgi:hypothetical protein
MSPTEGSASWENVCSDRSTTRPGFGASRSSTRQVTEAPVERFVTVTTMPKDSVGLAQVPGAAPYHEASPVSASSEAAETAGAGGRAGAAAGVVAVVARTVLLTGMADGAGVVVVVVVVVLEVVAAYFATIASGTAHRDCASVARTEVDVRVNATGRA